jgi:hypothetical protein
LRAKAARDCLRLWIPFAVAGLAVIAYAVFYAISAAEPEGAASLGLANIIGLLGVIIALIAAVFIFGRATPQR